MTGLSSVITKHLPLGYAGYVYSGGQCGCALSCRCI